MTAINVEKQMEMIANNCRLQLADCPPIYPVPPPNATWNTVKVGKDDKLLHKYLWLIDQIDLQIKMELKQVQHLLQTTLQTNMADLVYDYFDGSTEFIAELWSNLGTLASFVNTTMRPDGSESSGMMYCYVVYTLPELFLFEFLLQHPLAEYLSEKFHPNLEAYLAARFGKPKTELHPLLQDHVHIKSLVPNVLDNLIKAGFTRFLAVKANDKKKQ